jgi:hypothetical protein
MHSHDWYEITDKEAIHFWKPTLIFKNILSVQKLSSYGGGSNTKSFWFQYPHRFEYSEEVQVTVSCDFDFRLYPFDSHECHVDFGDPVYEANVLVFSDNINIYFDGHHTAVYADSPIALSKVVLPYDIEIKAKGPFEYLMPGINEIYCYTGIKFTFTRNSLGLLMGGFYGPTGTFALLSLISFVIDANAVSNILICETTCMIQFLPYKGARPYGNVGYSLFDQQ